MSFPTIKNLMSRIFLLSMLALFPTLFSSCHLFEDDDDYGKFFNMLREGVVSLDGSLALDINSMYDLGDGAGMIIPGAYDNVWYEGSYYRAGFSFFHGWEGKSEGEFTLSKGHNTIVGSIVVKLKKFHGDDEMTVSVSGVFNIPSIRMKVGKVPGSPSVESFAHYGFKGMVNENVDARGVTCDGRSQLRFLFDDNAYDVLRIYPHFYDINDEEIPESEYYTGTFSDPKTVSVGTGQAWYVIYTAPTIYDTERNPRWVDLEVIMGSEGHEYSMTYETSIDLYPCGVGLVHGLWSDAESCFGKLRSYILDIEGYNDNLVQMIDYEHNHALKFDQNQFLDPVVDRNLNEMYDRLLSLGIVSSKYDLVGHSMGGILSRLYAQKTNPYAVRKIITLDTPHFGSQLADLGKNLVDGLSLAIPDFRVKMLLKAFYYTQQSALVDLATTSEAIQALNDDTRLDIIGNVAVHAICSVMLPPGSSVESRRDWGAVVWRRVDGAKKALQKVPEVFVNFNCDLYDAQQEYITNATWDFQKILYGEPRHDGVVSLTSQRGGLRDEFVTIEEAPYAGNFGYECQAHHINTNQWGVSFNNIGRLLVADLEFSNEFCMGGFGPMPAKAPGQRRAPEPSYYSLDNSGDNAVVILPCDEQSDGTFRFSLDTGANIVSGMILATLDDGEETLWVDAGDKNYELLLDGSKGRLTVHAIGRTADNGIVTATREFDI